MGLGDDNVRVTVEAGNKAGARCDGGGEAGQGGQSLRDGERADGPQIVTNTGAVDADAGRESPARGLAGMLVRA